MQISDNIATFSKPEIKLMNKVMNVQDYVKSNSAGDQKHLDTPGITNLANVADAIQKKGKLDLTDRQDLDAPTYAKAVISYVNAYKVYAASINTLTPQIKKLCDGIQNSIKDYLKSANK